VGGPHLAAQALEAGLVDECHLFLSPVVVGGGNQALPDGLRLAGDVVGGGDLRHGADLVLERAAGTQVVAGQARGHVHVQREPDNGGVEPGQLDVRPVRVALEGATFAALAAAGTLWGTSVPQTRLALSLAGVWLVAAGGGAAPPSPATAWCWAWLVFSASFTVAQGPAAARPRPGRPSPGGRRRRHPGRDRAQQPALVRAGWRRRRRRSPRRHLRALERAVA
jgi:hypothetical protein